MTSSAVDPRALSADEQIARLVALEGEINRLYAEQLDVINAIDDTARRSRHELDKTFVAEDIAAALRVSSMTAADRLGFARELRRMPRLFDLLRCGEVTVMHARVAARQTLLLPEREQVDAFLDRVLPKAMDASVGQFNRSCQRAAIAVGADPAKRRAKAYADRRIASRPADDGMGELYGFLPADDIAAIMTKVETSARRVAPGDERTLEQKRADAFVAAVLGSTGDGKPTVRTTVNVVTVAESTLAGADGEPADLARFGAITAEHARDLAAAENVRLRRFVTDTTGRLLDITDDRCDPRRTPGHLLDYGRTVRIPPAALDQYVRARDVTCRFPGCTASAQTAELDHIIAWIDGGNTSANNLHALCRRHHHVKHEAGWKVHRRDDGTTVWRSPTGRSYEVPPHDYRPPGGPATPT